MCQTSAIMEKAGVEELLLENVTSLEFVEGGVQLTTLFDGVQNLPGAAVRRIDFAGGKIFLYQRGA
jgi:predicted RNA-binding protein